MPGSNSSPLSFLLNKDESLHSGIQASDAKKVSTSNLSPSGDYASSSNNVPHNIYVFRTITALLGKIQQGQRFRLLHSEIEPDDFQCLELKLSNALSTVAVIEHEVIAVVSHRSVEGLQVTASSQVSESESSKKPSLVSYSIKVDAKDVPELHDNTDESIRMYASAYWSHSTISKHLYILSRLLTMKHATSPAENKQKMSDILLNYVAATCYPKMLRRLTLQPLSDLHIKALQSIENISFNEHVVSNDAGTAEEEQNDYLFLTKFILNAEMLFGSFPNIIKQARLAAAGGCRQFYSKDTCKEFHMLLVLLILRFRDYLVSLQTIRSNDLAKDPTKPIKGSDQFKDGVTGVVLCGYALQRLAKGHALRLHIKNITPALCAALQKFSSDSTQTTKSELEEADGELREVQPFVKEEEGRERRLWSTYVDWLRLMVSHFDAIDILVGFVTGPNFNYEAISIQVLFSHRVDKHLLPWRTLFDEMSIFSKKDAENQAILSYLDSALLVYKKAAKAREIWSSCKGRDLLPAITAAEELGTIDLPGWKQFSEELVAKLKNISSTTSEISQDFDNLTNSVKFFKYLDTKPLFNGSLHCELCLASLFDPNISFTNIWEHLKKFGTVIGVSKRCCPVCFHALNLIAEHYNLEVPFIVRGFHNTVTPCTLPTWLPSSIVDSMNTFFGNQLKQELVSLMRSNTLLRKRAGSTGSHRLSPDANQEVGDNNTSVKPIMFAKFAEFKPN